MYRLYPFKDLIPNIQLLPGTYIIRQISKVGWISTTKTEQKLELLPGENKIVEFGNYQPGVIIKFWDKNSNGRRDIGESGLSGWLFKITGTSLSTTKVTDANGNIMLTELPGGNYTIEEIIPDDTDWYNTSSRTASINLPGGSLLFGNDKYRTLNVFKFNDLNKNGKFDENEPGLKGWEFLVEGISDPQSTNSKGFAAFKVKANEQYLVSESLPVNWLNSTPLEVSIYIDPANDVTNISFGDYRDVAPQRSKSEIKIHVFNDTNRNGEFDPGEPGLPKRMVSISNLADKSSISSITTDSNGDFIYASAAGTYKLEQSLFSNWCTNGEIAIKVSLSDNESKTVYFGTYPCIFSNCEYRYRPNPGNLSQTLEDENLIVVKSVDPYVLSLANLNMTKGALINYTITVCAKPKIGPTDIILAVDTSGSVIEDDKTALNKINRGIYGFVTEMEKSKNSDIRIGLVSWDSNIDESVNPTLNYEEVLNASNKLRANSQELTMYHVGMNGSLAAFDASPREGTRKVIVFITDARNEYEPFLRYPEASKYAIFVILLNKPQINETYDMLRNLATISNGKLIQVDEYSQITSSLLSILKTSLIANGTFNDINIEDTLPTYLRTISNGINPGKLTLNEDGVNWTTSTLNWSIPSLQFGKCWSTTFTTAFCWKLQANVAHPSNSLRATSQVDYADPIKTGRKIIPLPEGTIWIETDDKVTRTPQTEGLMPAEEAKPTTGFELLFASISIILIGRFCLRRES